MKRNSGFTLIELLVVIAIIGILSSVVLASLNSARSKAADTAVKSDLTTVRTQAELYVDSNPYGTLGTSSSACLSQTSGVFSDATVKSALTQASNTGGGTVTCASSGSDFWAVAASLKSDNTKSWCVSSNGTASQINTASALTSGNSCI